ncbi:MAG TPA: hypothetical protein VE954_21035 [Oligoflexus sp.]|uniref:hypothetical protein n=1 Tax=Oligoflexus sp. TaxID=1971216 RepID=UPI002D34479C|nr:hypothetical protein [Oligoflexus sp.]HYX35590.1 hypothetical protein [Oligoflexus sp.]
MNLNTFLPTRQQHTLARTNLRSLAMVGFGLFYLLVLCPLFFLSTHEPLQRVYGLLFIALNLAAGVSSLIFLRRTGNFKLAGLFLCTFSVGVGTLLSLESEAAYTPSLYWLPFLITFMALLDGVRGSLTFAVLSCFFLVAYFLVAPRLGIPTIESAPYWTHSVLMHMVLSQMAFYAVIFVFECLREVDNRDVQRQKHRLMQSAKVQSTRSLSRLMEKKILACADVNRQAISTIQRNPGHDSKVTVKSLEIVQRQMEGLCQIADYFLDGSLEKVNTKDGMVFVEELLREDPHFHLVDFQFKASSCSGSIGMRFQELYPWIEMGLELLIKPWREAHNFRVMVEGEHAQESYLLHFNAFVPQGGENGISEIDNENFASLLLPHRLEINSTSVRLTLIMPYLS